jgi:PEGA domain
MFALSTIPAEAQHHHGGGGHVTVIPHSPLLWGVGFGFFGGFYSPYYLGFGQWYPYPYAYPAGAYPNDPGVSVRLLVTPREASVFVDGYAAGIVDDYDGVFQRLRLVPGPHEIVIYHPGHHTLRQHIYYNPGSTHTIRQTLNPLAPGEPAEPQPVPRAFPAMSGMPAPVAGNAPETARLGTLVLRVQPGDASVLVDGEPWRGSESQDRLLIQLAEGAHRVRVEKDGFQTFAVEVDVHAGETAGFNVSLLAR